MACANCIVGFAGSPDGLGSEVACPVFATTKFAVAATVIAAGAFVLGRMSAKPSRATPNHRRRRR